MAEQQIVNNDHMSEHQNDNSEQQSTDSEQQNADSDQQNADSDQQTVNTDQIDGVSAEQTEQVIAISDQQNDNSEQQNNTFEQHDDVSRQENKISEIEQSVAPEIVSEQQAAESQQSALSEQQYPVKSEPVSVSEQQFEQNEQQIMTAEQYITQNVLNAPQDELVQSEGHVYNELQAPEQGMRQILTVKSEQDLMSPNQYTSHNSQQNASCQLLLNHSLQPKREGQMMLESHFETPRHQHLMSPRLQVVTTTSQLIPAHTHHNIIIHGQQMASPGQQIVTSGQHMMPFGQQVAKHVVIPEHPQHNVLINRNQNIVQQYVQGNMNHSLGSNMSHHGQQIVMPGQQMSLAGQQGSPIQSLVSLTRAPPSPSPGLYMQFNRPAATHSDVQYMYSQYLRMLNK